MKVKGENLTRVIILGHTGFIGSHLLRKFLERDRGIEVLGYSRSAVDLTRWEKVQSLALKFDTQTAVIMCSAIKRHVEESLDAFHKNIQMVYNVARLLKEHPVKRVLFFSSAAVYGESLHDLNITEETLVTPVSYYGIAKYASECLLKKVAQEVEGLSLAILRPGIVYGLGDESEHYRPSAFAKSILSHGAVTLWGDGKELRDFIFVEDVAELVWRMTFCDYTGIYNVVSGETHTFRDILEVFKSLCPNGFQIRFQRRTQPKVDQGFENDKLLKAIPDFSYTSFQEGLTKTFLQICSMYFQSHGSVEFKEDNRSCLLFGDYDGTDH